MIRYAKHEEEFYGVFKLVSGEEVLGKAVLTEDNGETLCFVQNPVSTVVMNIKIMKVAMFGEWGLLNGCNFLMRIFIS